MSETNQPPRQSLGEISHLFLTGLRNQQAGAAAPPRRTPPPPRPQVSVDVTPREMAGHAEIQARPSVTAVLANHLSTSALQRVREYARHAATASGRVGLIELGDDGLRLTSFDASPLAKLESPSANPTPSVEPVNGQRIAEALEELSWDIQRWIVFLPGGAKSENARRLLAKIEHWTLLATADDDGIVAGYRTIKAAADIGNPTMSMAVFGADDEAHGALAHRKLSNAARQFLGRQMDCEGRVVAAPNATEHVVLWCRAASAGGAEKPPVEHWTAVMDLAEKSGQPISPPAAAPKMAEEEQPDIAPDPVTQQTAPEEPITMKIAPAEKASDRQEADEVVEISLNDGDEARAILNAVMKRQGQWVDCPIQVPMYEAARVAVDREGHLVLAATAGSKLSELPRVSRAYAWLMENRSLVRLALPQMKIDAVSTPKLALIVDQAEAAGDKLAAILQGGNVSVHTYRRLRWGEKTGLLLEAA